MMRRLYRVVRAHSRAVIFITAAVALAEVGFVCWQHTVQERLIEALTEQQLLPGALIVTSTPVERAPLQWRDRLRVTVASSLYSRDPTAAPFSFEVDVVGRFGPFGLTGDLYPLNTTADTASLLMRLAGSHPRLAFRYRWNIFTHSLEMTATAQPFDMQLELDCPGVGPISWHVAAGNPVGWKFQLKRTGVLEGELNVPEFSVTLTDPAANIHRFSGSRAVLKTLSRMESTATTEKSANAPTEENTGAEWYLDRGTLDLKSASFETGDWRGILRGTLEGAKVEADQTSNIREEELEGTYILHAKRLVLSVTESGTHQSRQIRHSVGRDLVLRMTADSVPSELLGALDEYRGGRILAAAAPLKLTLDELSMHEEARGKSEGPMTRLSGELSAVPAEEGTPGAGAIVDWRLEAEAPEDIIAIAGPLLMGSRRDAPSGGLLSLMEKRDTPRGAVWHYEASGHAEGVGRDLTLGEVPQKEETISSAVVPFADPTVVPSTEKKLEPEQTTEQTSESTAGTTPQEVRVSAVPSTEIASEKGEAAAH